MIDNEINIGVISIIMPVYNGEKYIKESIESVLNQTYVNWELLIIDDGSIDGTKEVIDAFDDARIKYQYQKNRGVSSARNNGLTLTKGEFVCFLDADDVMPVNSLESRLIMFDENVTFVDGKVELVNESNSQILKIYCPTLFNENPKSHLLMLDGSCFMGLTWMMRKKSINFNFKVGLTHCEDLLFYIKNSSLGTYVYTDAVVLKYRQLGNSAMTNIVGLEKGYLSCLNELHFDSSISKTSISEFRTKIKSIMVKSYLKKGMFISSIKTLFKFNK